MAEELLRERTLDDAEVQVVADLAAGDPHVSPDDLARYRANRDAVARYRANRDA